MILDFFEDFMANTTVYYLFLIIIILGVSFATARYFNFKQAMPMVLIAIAVVVLLHAYGILDLIWAGVAYIAFAFILFLLFGKKRRDNDE